MSRLDFPWTLAVIALAIVATATAPEALVADQRIFDGQGWRLVTGPFIHATWGHLVRDLALVALAGIAYEGPLRSRRRALFAAGIVVPALAVLLARHAVWYCGLSGLSHALLAAALSYEVIHRRGAARVVVLGLCAVSAVKPLYEVVTGAPAFPMSLGSGVVQVPLAHVVGVCVGIVCGLAAGLDQRRSASPPNGSVIASSPSPETLIAPRSAATRELAMRSPANPNPTAPANVMTSA
jgi:rhomboid family GlyGly-CTERM serine protease